MNSNNNNKKSKAERRAQSQRDKANAKAALKPQGGVGKRKGARPRKQKQASAAAAYATGQVGQAPVIKMSRDTCRIVHRELIASVSGTTAFTVAQSFALQPGLASTFPWLSIMAQGWQEYRFRKLRFCYYTRTGSNVPGSVMLAPDYDAADAPPVSEQVASAYEDVAEDAPWKDIECECQQLSMAAGQTRHFTRTGALAANLDIKTYDVGNLHLCTVDGTAVNWGKLWVEYDVDFFVPQLPPTGVSATSGVAENSAGTGTSNASFLGTSVVIAGGIGISGAANVLAFSNLEPGAEYLVTACDQTAGSITVSAPVGMTVKTTYLSGGSGAYIATWTANAATGGLTMALGAGSSGIMLCVAQIATLPV